MCVDMCVHMCLCGVYIWREREKERVERENEVVV